MDDRYKKFAQFLLNYFDVKLKLDEMDFELIEKKFKEFEKNELIELSMKNKPGLMYISWNIANYFGLDSLIVIEGKGRKRELTQPRQICYYIANKIYRYTQQEIADFFGGNTANGTKNHATILSGIRRTQNLMDTEKDYNELVNKLIEKIKDGNNNQRTDTTTSTESIYGSTESEGNDLPLDRDREIESSDRLLQREQRYSFDFNHLSENQSERELEKRTH
jgi:hypothetical protein